MQAQQPAELALRLPRRTTRSRAARRTPRPRTTRQLPPPIDPQPPSLSSFRQNATAPTSTTNRTERPLAAERRIPPQPWRRETLKRSSALKPRYSGADVAEAGRLPRGETLAAVRPVMTDNGLCVSLSWRKADSAALGMTLSPRPERMPLRRVCGPQSRRAAP
jgi:hypothetical protein